MKPTLQEKLEHVEERIRQEFPDVPIEFGRFSTDHRRVEIWVNVLNHAEFPRVRDRCDEIAEEEDLDSFTPDIRIYARPHVALSPEAEQRIMDELERKRQDFLRRHPMMFGRNGV